MTQDSGKVWDFEALNRLLADGSCFDDVESRLAKFNLFEAVGLTRQEIRHSNFLAFLLNPSSPHSLGDLVLRRVFAAVGEPEITIGTANSVTVKREWRSLDLLVECREARTVLVIENKIGIGEHSDQLQRYRDIVVAEYPANWQHIFVLLSPTGSSASVSNYHSLDYRVIYEIVGDLLDRPPNLVDPDLALVLRHYRELLVTHVIEDKELDALCDAIYSKHSRALELIFERRTGPRSVVNGAIERWIGENQDSVCPDYTSNRYIKFLPREWIAFSPINDTQKGRELHSLTVLLTSDRDRLNVSVELHKGGSTYRNLLLEIARQEQPPFNMRRRKAGGQFSTLYSRDILLPKDYEGEDPDELRAMVSAALNLFATGDLAAMTERFLAQAAKLCAAALSEPNSAGA